MKAIEVRGVIDVEPDALWALLGDFGGVASWNPFVERLETRGDGAGMVRTVHAVGGAVVTEQLVLRDDAARRIRYTVELDSGATSLADVRLEAEPDGKTTVVWQSIRENEPDASARDAIVATLQSRINALRDAVAAA